jgi:hypothetical protein
MPIPAFDLGLVLPPFLGSMPGSSATQSPYDATTLELVQRFGTSPARNELLRGLVNFRSALRDLGLVSGFQWVDGSFVEDKERRLGLAPGDIDVVSVFDRPAGLTDHAGWIQRANQNAALFDPAYCKATFKCEAFYIDLGRSGQLIASQSAFWFSLFSHQRDTFRWKGVVRCLLGDDTIDADADLELTRRGF